MEVWFINYFTADNKPAVEKIMAATAHSAILKWSEIHSTLPGSKIRSVFSKEIYNASVT